MMNYNEKMKDYFQYKKYLDDYKEEYFKTKKETMFEIPIELLNYFSIIICAKLAEDDLKSGNVSNFEEEQEIKRFISLAEDYKQNDDPYKIIDKEDFDFVTVLFVLNFLSTFPYAKERIADNAEKDLLFLELKESYLEHVISFYPHLAKACEQVAESDLGFYDNP